MYCINYTKSRLTETGCFSRISKLVKLRKQNKKNRNQTKNLKTKKKNCYSLNWGDNFLLNLPQIFCHFKRQSYKMVLNNYLNVFDHFVGLALKGLSRNRQYLQIQFFPASNVWNKGHAHLAIFFCLWVT